MLLVFNAETALTTGFPGRHLVVLGHIKNMVKANSSADVLMNQIASSTQPIMLTPTQLRAARAIVGWTRADLAKRSSVAVPTITGFELQGADSKISTLQKLRRALEAAGVEFIDDGDASQPGAGPGVRLKGSRRK